MKKLFYKPTFCLCLIIGKSIQFSTIKGKEHLEKTARIILNRSNGNSAVSLFNKLKWLSFDNRLNYHIGVMTYKILNGHIPKYMGNLISMSHNHRGPTRSHDRKMPVEICH